jgi:hypothetical protein
MFVKFSHARTLAALGLATTLMTPAAAQAPLALSGPDTPDADYGYLSLVLPTALAQGTAFELRYDICNRRLGKMAFAWDEVGFGTDFTDPVGAGLCATYELANQPGYRRANTTIRFSARSQPASAYLPCASNCGSGPVAMIREGVAKLTAFIRGRELNAPTTNNVQPLRVVVRTRGDETSGQQVTGKQIRVNWAAPQSIGFLVLFPDAKLTLDALKRMLKNVSGAIVDFTTFPSLERAATHIVPSGAGLTVSPEKGKDFGAWSLELSPNAEVAGRVTIVVVQAGERVARFDGYFPPAASTAAGRALQ